MGFGRRTVLDYTQSKLIHLCVMAQNGWGDFPARFFMHTDAERKYAAGAARVRRASRGKNRSPTRLYTDAERKYAVGAVFSLLLQSATRIFPSAVIPRSTIKCPPFVKCPLPMSTTAISPFFKAFFTFSGVSESLPTPRIMPRGWMRILLNHLEHRRAGSFW